MKRGLGNSYLQGKPGERPDAHFACLSPLDHSRLVLYTQESGSRWRAPLPCQAGHNGQSQERSVTEPGMADDSHQAEIPPHSEGINGGHCKHLLNEGLSDNRWLRCFGSGSMAPLRSQDKLLYLKRRWHLLGTVRACRMWMTCHC